MASVFYNSFKLKSHDSSTKINLASGGDTIKVALVTSSYTPNIDSHDFFDDITNEVSSAGYTAGGATLGSQTYTQNNTTDKAVFDAADTSWTGTTLVARGAVIYKSTGVASTSPLICYIDFGTDYTTVGGTLAITWDSTGIFTLA